MQIARTFILTFLPLLLMACQRYSKAPLDLPGYAASLEARDPSSADVVAYVKRLATSSQSAPAYDPSDGLSLREAELVALFFNPRLRLARLRADVPRMGANEAGRWQDPELSVDVERIIESVEHPLVLAGMLNLTLPLSGRLGLERLKARDETTTEVLRVLAEERKVIAELRLEWLEWSAAAEKAVLTRRIIEELDVLVARADKLRDAGELDPTDARLLRLERARQGGRMRSHESEKRIAESRIKTRLGLVAAAPVKLVPSIASESVQLPAAEDEVRAAIVHSPRVRVLRAEYEVAERTLELAIQKQYPDLKIGGGLGTDRGDNDVLLGLGIPLPLFNVNRREIAEARAQREVARAAAEGEYERVLGELATARVRLEGARARVEQVERELAPLADQQVEDARRLGRAGVFNSLLLLEAIKTAHEARLEAVEAKLELSRAQRETQALLEPAIAPAEKENK